MTNSTETETVDDLSMDMHMVTAEQLHERHRKKQPKVDEPLLTWGGGVRLCTPLRWGS